MRRLVGAGHREAIQAGLTFIPSGIRSLLSGTHFLCGVDPVFVGLHSYEDTGDGRSYSNTAHCAYPFHQSAVARADRVTTIVLPQPVEPWVIVHELGHVLDERLGFDFTPTPVTAYAETHRMEAFAEAFTAWCIPCYSPWAAEIFQRNQATPALFNDLERRLA